MRILVCSKSEGVGLGIGLMLRQSPDIEIVGVLSRLEDVLSRCESRDFDLIFVAFNSSSWLEQLSAHLYATKDAGIKCVIGAAKVTSEVILLALHCGANAVLDMGDPLDRLNYALRQVVDGRLDLTKQNSVQDIHDLSPQDSILRLCRDNLDFLILSLLIEGQSNEAIAAKCEAAMQTVRNRLVRLMREANVDNRTHLATRLLRE